MMADNPSQSTPAHLLLLELRAAEEKVKASIRQTEEELRLLEFVSAKLKSSIAQIQSVFPSAGKETIRTS